MDQSLYTVGDARKHPYGITRVTVAFTVRPVSSWLTYRSQGTAQADVDDDAAAIRLQDESVDHVADLLHLLQLHPRPPIAEDGPFDCLTHAHWSQRTLSGLGGEQLRVVPYNSANRSEEAHPSTRRRAGPSVSSI